MEIIVETRSVSKKALHNLDQKQMIEAKHKYIV